ncbi:ATP-dependent zinc metalloprotease FtsH [Gudongella oleilytica]|jgi:cell division protease FtsH|uniref:ATP-dependent zinc metalloprotease FtsH n=1 Tax=Gudongella oleilytica TaxID=1582259 RepID=UPI002A35E439|nr:ATP-dependent zinc metalloprotease FtsH [Gudongella oleilytica]MDY0257788.1 ATP-dependent zinc metalloprotease FtsH [Gudongella oleilytica]HMM69711.1 ATP-dependent zinc metalloprotease FtsH [Gudongella oleilytica]
MKKIDKPKKPIMYYYVIAMLIVILLNSYVFPRMAKPQIEPIDYGTFLQKLENGEISVVEIKDNQIYLQGKGDSPELFSTGTMDDPQLVDRLYSAGVTFSRVVTDTTPTLGSQIFSWIITIAIFVGIGQLFSRYMQKKMMGGNDVLSFGKSNAKIYVESKTGKTFDDVAGQEEAKEALEEIVDFLHNPTKYKDIGANLPKGALLVGPPGTGKTLLARAVAGEANVPFFSISGSEFVQMFVGMGAAKVRDLFKQAQEKAPCIVFIDEIDTIGKKRDSSGFNSNDEREQTLNQLLTEMDGFDGKEGVVILAATNRPESLDKALLRPGRFDRRIPVDLPDLQGREAILKVHARNVKVEPDLDYNAIARATAGANGAELANMINEAAIRAVKMGRETINQSDLEESVEVVLAGYQRKQAVISTKEKRIIAYHEIGHALVAAKQTDSDPVHKITIIPRTSGALGYTMQVAEQESVLMSKEELFNKIVTITGGRAAEEIVFGSITSGASNDIEQATKIARAMVTRFGMSDTFGMMALETQTNPYLGGDTSLTCSGETSSKVDAEVLAIIKSAHQRARDILNENIDKLRELSNYLLEMETITGAQFMEILNKDN